MAEGARKMAQTTKGFSKPYLGWAITLLCLINVLNYLDRYVIVILLGPIQQDLGISDTQAGLLTGIAFAAVFTVVGVPLARLADRGHRVPVLAGAVAVWSVMTALCGMAHSFTTMLLARIGVGVGEAGAGPSTQALVAEYFTISALGRAFAAIALASSLGTLLGYTLGGALSATYGWRSAFMYLGIPGAVLSLLAFFTLREPRANGNADAMAKAMRIPSLRDSLADLITRKSFVHVTVGLSISAIGSYGLANWSPVFFQREHAMGVDKVGTLLGLATAPAMFAGIIIGGILADKLNRRDARWSVWLFMLGLGGIAPLYLAMFLARDPMFGIIMGIPTAFLGCLWIAPGSALVQQLAGSTSRATAGALFGLAVNLIGMGLGPLVVGVLSDLLKPQFGSESLKYALCSVLIFLLYGLVHFALALRTVRADLVAASRIPVAQIA